MNGTQTSILGAAKPLAKNPLGIIALFIVLVYGVASLMTTFASGFSHEERMPLIYFLVLFPILVLLVFAWLVSSHNAKLFSPSDFKDEENYVRMQLSAATSLAFASAKTGAGDHTTDVSRIVDVVRTSKTVHEQAGSDWRNCILWVDDRPENNVFERKAFESIGFRFSLALSTNEALDQLSHRRFAAVISDMGRKEGPQEGYVLLDALREKGDQIPVFIYAGSNSQEHRQETLKHGGQGCTNNAEELFAMVTRTIVTSTR
ncbi:response regulator [Caballeronia sp. ATUFL_M2_KS44]|uniref:response regulator n=1 Tax=Caballeronia sp. ATUFL_M2_KS44 TaxID=2921767 RepID=UPI002028986F|nr:response regulator [Caballeronia sp. ATUFL_M2_KS44]